MQHQNSVYELAQSNSAHALRQVNVQKPTAVTTTTERRAAGDANGSLA
jgi:hypothetical protein